MDNWLVGAALLSAALHAVWKAAVKASPQPNSAMTGQMLVSAMLAIPALAWAGLPGPSAWPWIMTSTLLSLGAVASLLRGYELAGFGVVYPIARASSVLLVLPLAAAVAGERPGVPGLAGVALVSSAFALLALGSGKARAMTRPAGLWTLAAGAFTAGYVVSDAQGVRQSQSPLAYGAAMSITNAAAWTWLQRRAGLPLGPLVATWPRALPSATAATLSYWLILWVWTRAPIAPGSALRDTSAIFAAVIAFAILEEPLNWRVGIAFMLATAGSMLIRLG